MADLPATPPAEAPAAVVAPAPAASAPIYVDGPEYRYSVVGNTLLSRAEVEKALLSATTPKEAIDALNKAYENAGYLLVIIGGQVDNKLVAFTVLQGRILELDAPEDVRPFLSGLMNRDDLKTNQLIRNSAMLEIYTGRQGMRPKATFSKAQEIGGTKLTVVEEAVPDAKPWSAGLAFNNLSGRFSSRYTVGGNVAVRPGGGLELTAGYTQGIPGLTSDSSGSVYRSAVLGASIVTPLGIYAVNFSKTEYQIGPAGGIANPGGSTEYGGITGQQLVFADPQTRVAVTEGLTWYQNTQTVFEDFQIVDQRYAVATLGATYNQTFVLWGQNSNFGGGVTLAKGLSPRTGSFLPPDPGVPDPHFLLIQANASVQTTLPFGITAAASVNAQMTDAVLPQAQQWILGGFGNLSAWLPAVLIGDSGALGRLVLTSPPFAWGAFTFSGGGYAEAGVSRLEQRGIGEPHTRGLGDVGLTLSAGTTTGTSLTLTYGFPVWYRNVEGAIRDSADRNRAHLYFTLNQSF